ncbi:NAD(P)H-dependent glycerol-3-phosphate dehydrogenase [Corynebacterium sp. ES2715-CONJ3]|uniref:NAD(P)H-dependent glycerol-3-phosphate dehydrogenase n=1 Tax=Corynebacterium sp. ES2715-CONJ3 TaxID=2974028 RepID=UPI00216773E8|nr:NAD(P)H-dependent glycerol-3-phosphate dehydrogenase [Corynebacterium sp. ES2715-CONJ3]MCS4492523.1 NAD(P)-dependent glycerol-3-phosphate dehydrogenase [Corynebacterium sp. ES2715-CONJ3]
MLKIAVMGAGSWGTTMAKIAADAGNEVVLWARREEVAEYINTHHHNPDYLSDIYLRTIVATSDARAAISEADIVVFAVPSQTLRGHVLTWAEFIPSHALVVSLSKGVEKQTFMRMSEVIAQVSGIDSRRIAVLTGPNLAREIALEQPAATVIACPDEHHAQVIQEALAAPYFRPYTNTDVVGCEISGACKNVIALACGMAAGRDLGENTLATLITRGLAEISRLGIALGANPLTFAGLAGMGDLVATCSSPLSRNRTFGDRLGRGASLEQARAATHGQVAEGVTSSASVYELAQSMGVEMPISQAVYAVCHKGMTVEEMVGQLMGRSKKSEHENSGYSNQL